MRHALKDAGTAIDFADREYWIFRLRDYYKIVSSI